MTKISDPVNASLEHRIIRLAKEHKRHPFGCTIIAGIGTTLGLLEGIARDGFNKYALMGIPMGLGLGVSMDALRYVMSRVRVNRLQKDDNPLVKVLDQEVFGDVLDEVRRVYGLHGRCSTLIAQGSQEGTSVFKKGYNMKVVLKFEDGEVPLLYKWVDDPKHAVAASITSALRKSGNGFAPHSIRPSSWNERHSDEGKRNNGALYEWVDAADLESARDIGSSPKRSDGVDRDTMANLIERLSALHSISWPGKFRDGVRQFPVRYQFHHDVVRKLGENRFSDGLNRAHANAFASVHAVPVHGDVHQGNILGNGEYLIDWDNAHFGLPYHDLFHFAVISDADRSPYFPSIRKVYLEWQERFFSELGHPFNDVMGQRGAKSIITPSQIALTESEVFISLLHRYHQALESDAIIDEFRPGVESSCKYLLERSRKSIREYSMVSGDRAILESFDECSASKWSSLDSVIFDQNASVAYAHRVNHRHRKADKESLSKANHLYHMEKTQSMVVTQEMERSYDLTTGLVPAVAGIGAMACVYFMNHSEMSPEQAMQFKGQAASLAVQAAGIVGMAYLAYNMDRVSKVLCKGLRRMGITDYDEGDSSP